MNSPRLVIFDLDDTLCDTSGQLESSPQNIENIRLFPGAASLLEKIHAQGVYNVIVSTGNRVIQEKKIELLELRPLVDEVFICDLPEEKRALIEQCINKFDVRPEETLVVGDRVDREISIGKELHCVTVRVMQGRHSQMVSIGASQLADFTIQNIAELKRWFEPEP